MGAVGANTAQCTVYQPSVDMQLPGKHGQNALVGTADRGWQPADQKASRDGLSQGHVVFLSAGFAAPLSVLCSALVVAGLLQC